MPDDEYERVSRAVAEARTETGRRRYREVMVSDAPPPATPYLARGVVDAVFGELWDRPGLSRPGTAGSSRSPASPRPRSTSRSNSTCTPRSRAATSRGKSSRRSCCTSPTTRAGRARRRSRWRTTAPSPASTRTLRNGAHDDRGAALRGERILITGATGQVANPLAKALARDNEVWAVAQASGKRPQARTGSGRRGRSLCRRRPRRR